MPAKVLQNEVGARFNNLIVISNKGLVKLSSGSKESASEYLCDCGKSVLASDSRVRKGRQTNCASVECEVKKPWQKRKVRKGIFDQTNPGEGYVRGLGPGWYSSYKAMKSRCYNEKNNRYYIYGGRGIKVCDRWLENPIHFFEDMGNRPDGMTLDRKDVDGNYSPENCRWATATQQARNKRNSRIQSN